MPCSVVQDIEDHHDSLELSITPTGDITGINYRTRKAWGLMLFEHTAVRLNRGKPALEPEIPEKPKIDPNKGNEPGGIMGFMSKYWWVFLLTFTLSSVLGGK